MHSTTCAAGAPHALPRGALLRGGQYRIEQTLGYGGFAITYLAYDTTLQRLVAIKELIPDGCVREPHTLSVTPQRLTLDQFLHIRQRFLDEARLLAQLYHPNIVRVYDAFEQNNTGYLVMEYLHGQTLAQLLRERGGVIPEHEAVGYILQVGEALQVVHQRGYLHRDIKPSNIIVTQEGRAVLIDLGAAREYASGQTSAHTVMLTPIYAALEQYATTAKLDERTDLYALGATLYHLVTGVPPLPAPDQAQGLPLAPPHKIAPEVSEAVSDAIVHAMGLRPQNRPASVQAWMDELRRAITTPPAQSASTPQSIPSPTTPVQKWRGIVYQITTSFLVIIFLILLLLTIQPGLATKLADLYRSIFPPRELVLSPPASGGSIDLNESIREIAPDGTISLEPGEYILSKSVNVDKPLRLVGKGEQGAIILKLKDTQDTYVVRFNSPDLVTLDNITFAYEGSTPANVCVVENGRVEINRCTFRGGVWDEQKRLGGSGLLLWNKSVVTVKDSVFEGNGLHGIEVQNEATLTAEGNTCQQNKYSGIYLCHQARGELRANACSNNGLHGIEVQNEATLTAVENNCDNNTDCGIFLLNNASGKVSGNTCRFNKWGIAVDPNARPSIGRNTLYGNKSANLYDWRR